MLINITLFHYVFSPQIQIFMQRYQRIHQFQVRTKLYFKSQINCHKSNYLSFLSQTLVFQHVISASRETTLSWAGFWVKVFLVRCMMGSIKARLVHQSHTYRPNIQRNRSQGFSRNHQKPIQVQLSGQKPHESCVFFQTGERVNVAVKTCKDCSADVKEKFMSEACKMIHLPPVESNTCRNRIIKIIVFMQ